jgi:hypothetical protein
MKSLAQVVWLPFVLSAGIAAAQTYEVSVSAALTKISNTGLGSIDQTDGQDDDSRLKGGEGAGIRLTVNTKGYYGHEAGFVYSRAVFRTKTTPEGATVRGTFEDKVAVKQYFYNFLMYMMPRGERWRPYITVGGQMVEYGEPSVPNWPGGGDRTYGFNYGGGIKLKIVKGLLFRIDARDYIHGKPYDLTYEDITRSGGIFRQQEYSAGFAIGF